MNASWILRCTTLEHRLAPASSPTGPCVKPHWDSGKASPSGMSHWRGKLKAPKVSFKLAAHLLGTCEMQLRPLGPLCRLQSHRQDSDLGPTAKPSPNSLLNQRMVSERTTPPEWLSQSQMSASEESMGPMLWGKQTLDKGVEPDLCSQLCHQHSMQMWVSCWMSLGHRFSMGKRQRLERLQKAPMHWLSNCW